MILSQVSINKLEQMGKETFAKSFSHTDKIIIKPLYLQTVKCLWTCLERKTSFQADLHALKWCASQVAEHSLLG